ncbi:MAG TPA: ribosome silencing factor [Pirellulaceae bacterium]|nr:ribosome silencing factor [Pirellulaceae bacterium]
MAKTSAEEASAEGRTTHSSLERAKAAARVALDNEAKDVLLLDMREITPLFDYFVIATGRSGRQVRAIADEVETLLKKEYHDERRGTEGYRDSRWVVLDFGDLVVHLFDAAARDFYRLEELWADAPRVDLKTDSRS